MLRWLRIGVVVIFLVVTVVDGFRLMNSRTFQFFGGLTARVDTTEKVVALTFDDGPSCDQVDAVRAALGDEPGTFFVIGDAADTCPEALTALVASGHELGNHTQTHRRMILVTPDAVASEIEPVDALVRGAGQVGDIPVRPPNGKKLVVFPAWLAAHQRNTIMWDVAVETFGDGAPMDTNAIATQTVAQVRPGSIVLLHPWNHRTQTVDAIPVVIEQLRAQGYRFVTVSQLLAMRS